ncbi:tRNA-dependent cyclodipeptide synthase [Streptomyces sp. DSM 44915]|uniref:Cyclodipeptide synthase n=1 Tax=Streptomyces chisholmiae TaxID=3075540 RepID=A0ABU2JSJ6_9ACTN|nr:tRNA-dependent cyclodipeptide synthase [Streptomyces sp. DSM 44915]MDT0267469.1 tRNA-dependent cyclodipeptide synthase [Streptomyces sp. DSM 44915]
MSLDAQGSAVPAPRLAATRRTRYKAEIASVSPDSSRNTFEQHETCFLGVSLENSNFTTAKLTSMVRWISRRFDRCVVLVGDSIHRLTLESTQGLPPDRARERALELGRSFVAAEGTVFEEYRGSTDFTFLNCGEVQAGERYAEFHSKLRTFFDEDVAFRSSVESFGHAYHRKRADGLSGAEWEKRIRMSNDYFLEEFAIFACLKEQGLSVMVYPGSFSTLSEIARGEHPGAPKELRDLVVVSLHLKGR